MDHQAFAQLLGNYGEFAGSIAVFATLIYLAIQVRQNTHAERRSALDLSVRNFIAIRQAVFENSEVSSISFKGLNDPESLNEEESYRFRLWFYNCMLSFWHIYAQPSDLKQELWNTQIPAVIRVIKSPGESAYWMQCRDEFVPAFRDEIDTIALANPDHRPFS
jgi:hypothetical protein